ncbi:MAG: hypothetical protein M3O30_11945 [Planctomycetota bacterium]|nr:hypothetical protein [Planctomycetota bacterium]
MSYLLNNFHNCRVKMSPRILLNVASLLTLLLCACASEGKRYSNPPADGSSLVGKTLSTAVSACPSGLYLELFQTRESIKGLIEPWEEVPGIPGTPSGILSDDYTDFREQVVTLQLPDGQKFSHWTKFTTIILAREKLYSVSWEPLRQPETLVNTIESLQSILADWKIEPTGDVLELMKDMKAALMHQNQPVAAPTPEPGVTVYRDNHVFRGNWSGGEAHMDIPGDAVFELQIVPFAGEQDRYAINMGICATQEWLSEKIPKAASKPIQ